MRRVRLAESKANPQVIGASSFIATQALLARGEDMKGAIIRGIDPATEAQVTDLAASSQNLDAVKALVPGEFGVVLGYELARQLGVGKGDRVTLIAPSGQVTPAGVVPRMKQLTVVGTFDSGHFEYDATLAMMHMDDAAKMFRLEGPTGIRLKLKDLHQARDVAKQLGQTLTGDLDRARLDAAKQNLVCRRAGRKTHDVHHFDADRRRGRLQPGVHAGDDGDRQTRRYRHFANAGCEPEKHHGHFCGAGRDGGGDWHAVRPAAGLGHRLQYRRDRALYRAPVQRQLFAERHLSAERHAQRAANERHHADSRHFPHLGLCRHLVPQLARQPHQPGGGA